MYRLPVVVCCIFLLFGVNALCAQEQKNNDYLAAYFVDWNELSQEYAQCDNGLAQTQRHFLLGNCPSSNAINAYYFGAALIHYTAANVLPEKYSRALQNSKVNFHFSIFKNRSSFGLIYNY